MILKLFLSQFPMFICLGGGGSSGTSTSSTLPIWATNLVKSLPGIGASNVAQYSSTLQPGGNPLQTEAGNTLQEEVTGADLNPETNPSVQAVNQATQQQANEQFQSDEGQIQGAANAGGALYSSGVPDAEAEAAATLASNVGATTANTGLQSYLQNLGIQANAVPAAQNFSQEQLNAALQIVNALRGWKGTGTTSNDYGNVSLSA